MADGEDLLMRPVLRGMCKYESLVDGTIGLDDIVRMNEAIECDDENRYRASEATKHGR